MKKSNIPVQQVVKIRKVYITLWQENGKIKQSGLNDYGYPECIAEFKDTYEDRKRAEHYIHGIIQGIEMFSNILNK